MQELFSLDDAFVPIPRSEGKNLVCNNTGFGASSTCATSLANLKNGSWSTAHGTRHKGREPALLNGKGSSFEDSIDDIFFCIEAGNVDAKAGAICKAGNANFPMLSLPFSPNVAET
mmetsp:Transcript_24009/g.33576  ORF Transcript_24009/g.33576 Transcript_24009/m.33576 type:complete len:116 (+) Transcript_24009:712-1059(+)